jgi:hypothetical protein
VAGIGGRIAAFFFASVNGLLTFAWHDRRIMPTVARLPGRIQVIFFHNDHDPPHFHVERPGADVTMAIADLRVLHGSLRRQDMLSVREWAKVHQAELAMNRVLARARLPLWDIPYP